MLTRKGDPIRTLVAALAVPLLPISTLPAHLTVPGITILDHIIPTERVPVRLATFPTLVIPEKLPERDRFTATGQFVLFRQLPLRKRLVLVDVLDGTNGQSIHIHVVQRIVTIGTSTVPVARLVVLETDAASGSTTRLALAVHGFLHRLLLHRSVFITGGWRTKPRNLGQSDSSLNARR